MYCSGMEHVDLLFKALADPLRIRILEFLKRPDAEYCSFEDKVCACDLERVLALSQPTISHHMKLLVQAGLVGAEKSGRWVYYRIERDAFALISEYLAGFTGRTVGAFAPAVGRQRRKSAATVN
jgi:ArsR family transcriptional regulator, arsenate/arsenite/antimonite-responsive transcriptional repressor